MMTVLTPIAFDVVLCMSQLFDYYLFAVYTFFATDMVSYQSHTTSIYSVSQPDVVPTLIPGTTMTTCGQFQAKVDKVRKQKT